MQSLKPIETIYQGYRMRSRLEARWAVFFDAMGIIWRYEPEGYDLDGIWYLPDFWLPQVNMWAEVKPDWPSADDLKKCEALVLKSSYPCLLLLGVPDYKEYPGLGIMEDGTVLPFHDYALVTRYLKTEHRFPRNLYCEDGYPDSFGDEYIEAVNAARQARFER